MEDSLLAPQGAMWFALFGIVSREGACVESKLEIISIR
jgi:hypothetical protein